MSTIMIAADARQSITPRLRERLVLRIVKDTKFPRDRAEHCLDEALAFLHRCAVENGNRIPSRTADVGWHTFLLFTRDYAAYCQQIAGRFIHHDPKEHHPGAPQAQADCCSHPSDDCGQGDDTSDTLVECEADDGGSACTAD